MFLCESICLSQDDPLKSSMHSFLMSSIHQQEIANLDGKVGINNIMYFVMEGEIQAI